VDPRAVLDAVVKRKIPSPCRESNPGTPIVQTAEQNKILLNRVAYSTNALVVKRLNLHYKRAHINEDL
jgi:hypothetical protein